MHTQTRAAGDPGLFYCIFWVYFPYKNGYNGSVV